MLGPEHGAQYSSRSRSIHRNRLNSHPEADAFIWQSKRLVTDSYTARVRWRTDRRSNFCLDAPSLAVLNR